jgi:CvfB-like winged helix domain
MAWIHSRNFHFDSRITQSRPTVRFHGRHISTIASTTGNQPTIHRNQISGFFGGSSFSHTRRWLASEKDSAEPDNIGRQTASANGHSFRPGDTIQVEVTSFGPLGASVDVVGLGHDGELLPANEEPYGTGLILQKEIAYFRQARDNVDVVRGEILSAYVQKVREEDGKLDISLRKFGGKAKSEDVGAMILERLEWAPGGVLDIGEKSSPKEISAEFPGVSKSVFKKALGGLYKKSLVKPGPNSIELIKKQ